MGCKSKYCVQGAVSSTLMVAADQSNRTSLQDNSNRHPNKAVQQHKGRDSCVRQGLENLQTGTNADTSVQKAAQADMQHIKKSIDIGTYVVIAEEMQQPAHLRMLSCSSLTRILSGNCSSLSSSSMRSSCTTHKCMLVVFPSCLFWVVSGQLFLFCLLLSR